VETVYSPQIAPKSNKGILPCHTKTAGDEICGIPADCKEKYRENYSYNDRGGKSCGDEERKK
jgi:hypothetical protein